MTVATARLKQASLVLQPEIMVEQMESAPVVAASGTRLVSASPLAPMQPVLCRERSLPHQAVDQPTHLRHGQG